MKYLLCFLVLNLFFILQSDNAFAVKFNKPDMKTLENYVSNSGKDEFNTLVKRLIQLDTTLTMEDHHLLYYGSIFYSNSSKFDLEKKLDEERNKLARNKQRTSQEQIRYMQLVKNKFENEPFNLDIKIEYMIALKESDRVGDFSKMRRLILDQVDMILSTGDGRSEKTAWYVIEVSDEYEILNVLGYDFGGSQSLTGSHCDYLELSKNDDNLKGLYFNVSIIFEYVYANMFKMDEHLLDSLKK